MAKEQQKTPEQLAKDFAQQQELHKKTLDSLIVKEGAAAGDVLFNPFLYGELGKQSAERVYDEAITGEEASKLAGQDYKEKLEAYRSQGIYGRPSRMGDGDLEHAFKLQRQEALKEITLGNLQEVLAKQGAKYELPEEFKKYNQTSLLEKATKDGKIDEKLLSVEEKAAFGAQKFLSAEYNRITMLNVSIKYQNKDAQDQWKAFLEQYQKLKSEKKSE